MKNVLLNFVTVCAVLLPITDGFAQDLPDLFSRGAAGDVTEFGGARRLSHDMTAALKASLVDTPAKNVILFIGDGMGDSEITVARNYAKGAGGYFAGIDSLPITGQYTHYSIDEETGKPDYVTDSSAAATAWATGVKTYDRSLSVDIKDQPHPTLLELAKAAGYATGDISTAAIQDATPAALVAHVTHRDCDGPEEATAKCPLNALENGGAGSITEQLLFTRADLIMGGGADIFKQVATAGAYKGQTMMQQALALGFVVATNADELAALTAANQDAPVLGLFATANFKANWTGPKATYHGNIDLPPITCEPNPNHKPTQPSLAAMTSKSIELLQVNPKGFFLQVEGASIDKSAHAAHPCGQIGETVDFDEAIQVGMAFAREHGDTLVIVTADHGHATQIIERGASAPGLTASLLTADGAVMDVSYATSETVSQGHTGPQLRIAAYGPHAANVAGLTDQTDLFFTIRDAMGLQQPPQ